MKVDYRIVCIPSYIAFECPYCDRDDAEVSLNKVNFNSGYEGNGGKVRCPYCNKEIELGDYEYD